MSLYGFQDINRKNDECAVKESTLDETKTCTDILTNFGYSGQQNLCLVTWESYNQVDGNRHLYNIRKALTLLVFLGKR